MKLTGPACAAVLISGGLSVQAFDVPRSVHSVDKISQATAEATKTKRGILFVYTDPTLKPS
jgi:hypothetical protein